MRTIPSLLAGVWVLGVVLVVSVASCQHVGIAPLDDQPDAGSSPTKFPGIELDAFITMARHQDCAGIRNDLYVIDGALVFTNRVGRCSDASYAQVLYGARPDAVLCHLNDSFAGRQRGCSEARFEAMFDVIVQHLDDPRLGLGPPHTVERVEF